MDRKPINAHERLGFFQTAISMELLLDAWEGMKSRKNLMYRMNNDFSRAVGACKRLMERFCDTVPDDQLVSLTKNVKRFKVHYGVELPPQRRDSTGFWLSESDLQTMSAALAEHCLGCMKDVTEQRACGLKKVLDRVSAPEHAHGCDWAEMLTEIAEDK